jgi:hypothetical protein
VSEAEELAAIEGRIRDLLHAHATLRLQAERIRRDQSRELRGVWCFIRDLERRVHEHEERTNARVGWLEADEQRRQREETASRESRRWWNMWLRNAPVRRSSSVGATAEERRPFYAVRPWGASMSKTWLLLFSVVASLLVGFVLGRASGGRYQLIRASEDAAWKFDRWTGTVENIRWRRPPAASAP